MFGEVLGHRDCGGPEAMSDRNQDVRRLAEEIVRTFIPASVELAAIDPELAVRAETSRVAGMLTAFRSEREADLQSQLHRACELLMEDDGFHEAMEIMCPLAGLTFPAATVRVEPKDLRDFFRDTGDDDA